MMDSENPRIVYADIIDHPHHQSETRAHMTLYDRAAQFSAFDALAGYSDMIAEEARVTEQKVELDKDVVELLNKKLAQIADTIKDGQYPSITFRFFDPDERKTGGKYKEEMGVATKVDPIAQKVVLRQGEGLTKKEAEINFKDIIEIYGECVDFFDESQ